MAGVGPAQAFVTPGRPGARTPVAVSLGDSFASGTGARWKGSSPAPGGDHLGTDRGTGVYGTTATGCQQSDVAEIASAGCRAFGP